MTTTNPLEPFKWYAILVILIILSLAYAAQAQQTWLRVEQGAGAPTFNPTTPQPKTGYVYKNTTTGDWSIWVIGTSWQPTTIFDGNKGDKGDKGDTGAQGLPGKDGQNGTGGGSIAGVLSPDDFKAKHSTQLISSSDLSFFSSVGATTSDTYDWGAWAMCLSQCDLKTIAGYSVYYWNRSEIKPPLAKCKIVGNCKIISSNNNVFTMLTTVMPADFASAEARNGAGASFSIEDVRFEGTLNQIAFQPYATSDNYLRNVSTAGFKAGIILNFCLGGIYDNITCLNGTDGFINGWGGYIGDTPISSRYPTSNGSKIRNYHAVNITNIGIANYGGYNVEINIKAIEGNAPTINRAIDLNDMGNTALKNFLITDGGDFEGVSIANGVGNAYIHIETVVGDVKVKIFGTNMQTAGKFIWAKGANNPCVILENVNNIFAAHTGNSLYSDGYSWQFNYCSAYAFPTTINVQFSTADGGKSVTPCNPVNGQPTYNAQGCGADHYNYLTQGK